MKVIDISLPLAAGMVVWPGDQGFALTARSQINKGDMVNVTTLCCSAHTGTHVDAPYHFVDTGKTLEQVDLSRFCGPGLVVEVSGPTVTRDDCAGAPLAPGDIVLFKTANSARRQQSVFAPDYVYISEEAARYLVDQGVKGVGIDYLSIAQFGQEAKVHQIILEAELGVIENIDLDAVSPGRYLVVALPLKITGGDGSPVRAVLIAE